MTNKSLSAIFTESNISEICIRGGNKLQGVIPLCGDKVSANHLLLASMIPDVTSVVRGVPFCGDVLRILNWIEQNNLAEIQFSENTISIIPIKTTLNTLVPISHIRASICLVTALALKFGDVTFSQVGGCAFTKRPIYKHLSLIEKFGIKFNESGLNSTAKKVKTPETVAFDCSIDNFGPSVGITCHALIAALQFDGEIILQNVALEPAVQTLIEYLQLVTDKSILIEGRNMFISRSFQSNKTSAILTLPVDFTVAITYVAAALATKGNIIINNISYIPDFFSQFLEHTGTIYSLDQNSLKVSVNKVVHPVVVNCKAWPDFPSDAGPVIAAGLACHKGKTRVVDRIYNERSSHVVYLKELGFDLTAKGQTIYIQGKNPSSQPVTIKAPDIRGGAALIIGALARPGKTTVTNFWQVFRGYPDFVSNLISLGAEIEAKR